MKKLKERDGLLINNWYIACLSSDLKKKPVSRTIYDTPLVFFRDEKEEAKALLDKCCHRAVPLSKGGVKDGCLVCPYHSWSYGSDGELKKIPSLVSDDLPKVKVRKFYTNEQDGVIWVWMGKEKPASKPWSFPYKNDSSYQSYYMVTDFENEVTQLAENFMDVAHTVTVHKNWFRKESFKKILCEIKMKDACVNVEYMQPEDNIGNLLSKLVNPKRKPMKHTDKFIFPNITRVDYSFGVGNHWIINSQCTPISNMKTRVYTHISYKIPWISRLILPLIKFYTYKVIMQDVDIMKTQSENLIKFEKNKFISSCVDLHHSCINKLRCEGVINPEGVNKIEASHSVEMFI